MWRAWKADWAAAVALAEEIAREGSARAQCEASIGDDLADEKQRQLLGHQESQDGHDCTAIT